MLKKFCEYKSTIPSSKVESENYQRELKEIQNHYGIRSTLDSVGQAQWDKEGALVRLDPCYEHWLRVDSAKDILGAEFALKVHKLLGEDKSAKEIIAELGKFEDYLSAQLVNKKYLFGAKVISALKRTKKKWWFEY